ncbi:MAG: sulfotransferase [Rhodocyclaceae bacterium]|nr:sulfotransferase [Rhodocyclaceae bacterium]
MTSGDASLDGWLPIRLYWRENTPWIDWCHVGDRPLAEPFFDHSIEQCLRLPFNRAFRRQTPIEVMTEQARLRPGLPPDGFVFHTSRCGSTLMAQLLTALDDCLVVSEASVVRALLSPQVRERGVSESQQVAWLRALLGVLGAPRRGERRYFVKWEPWHSVDLPLLQHAFPDARWIFMYRDPLEVMVSLDRECGGWLVPGAIDPAMLRLDAVAPWQLAREDYHARVLARICDAALGCGDHPRALFVDYDELPGAAWGRVARHFGIACSAVELQRLRERAQRDAKAPRQVFRSDRAEKAALANESLREATERWLVPRFRALAKLRERQDAWAATAGDCP